MKIFTSYYAMLRKMNLAAYTLIRVSATRPDWSYGIPMKDMPELYPSYSLLHDYKHNGLSWEEYTQRYIRQLDTLDADKVYEHLEELSDGKDIVLLCYEAPNKNCHRHIIGQWLGVETQELKF